MWKTYIPSALFVSVLMTVSSSELLERYIFLPLYPFLNCLTSEEMKLPMSSATFPASILSIGALISSKAREISSSLRLVIKILTCGSTLEKNPRIWCLIIDGHSSRASIIRKLCWKESAREVNKPCKLSNDGRRESCLNFRRSEGILSFFRHNCLIRAAITLEGSPNSGFL